MKIGTFISAAVITLTAGGAFAQTLPAGGYRSPLPAGQNVPTPTDRTLPASEESRPAGTEEIPRGQTIFDRPRPDYDPLGVRLDGFLLFPSFSVRQLYNSNIYATEKNVKDDFITMIEPSVDLKSDWNNHSLSFHADAAIARHWNETTENFEDFTLAGAGRLDVSRQTQIFAGLGYRLRHEERGSPDDVGGKEPTEFSIASVGLGVQQSFNRLSFRLDGTLDRYSYTDTPAFGGGKIDQSDRDRDQLLLKLRTAYEFAPLREIYLLTNVNQRLYRQSRDNSGVDRDSKGFEVAIGLKYDLTGVTFIDFFLGYSQQDYQDPSLKTAKGPSGGLKLTWNVTTLTTVSGTISREIEETTVGNSSSYFSTKAEARVDHELLRNLILTAFLAYQQDSFQGIDRDDSYYRAGFGTRYMFNRNLSAEGGYTYRHRDSNVANSNFSENIVFVRLVGKL
jgi:hypothetical protein